MPSTGVKDKGAGGGDGRFFSTTKKGACVFEFGDNLGACIPGETQELRAELQSGQREKKVDAVKKVIANMTVGKDARSPASEAE